MATYHYKGGFISNYYQHGRILHREDGPAYTNESGTQQWWIDGELHRIDGPAVIKCSGYEQYWIYGRFYSQEEFEEHPERQKYLFEQELERVLNE